MYNMDVQNRMDYDHWRQAHSSKAQDESKTVNAWIKEKNTKKNSLDPKYGKYTSMNVYMKGILKQSLIASVPEITTTKSWTKKIIKIIVFILCLIGFIYQTQDFLQIYMSYPTIFNVFSINPFMITQPAITFCNINWARRSAMCINNFTKCDYMDEKELCQMYPNYCYPSTKPFTGIPEKRKFPMTLTWHQASIAAHNESMVDLCLKRIEGKLTYCKKPYRRFPVIGSDRFKNFCYTIESLWGQPDAELQTHPNTFRYHIRFRMQPEEYRDYQQKPSIRIAVHDRRRLVNPTSEGYALRGGMMYRATVDMAEKKLMPAPYDTNCTDYLKLWRENNGTGPMNELCIEHCKLKSLLKKGKCIDINIDYSHTENICKREGSITNKMIENCIKSCGSPCFDYSYDVKFEETDTFENRCNGSEYCKIAYIDLTVLFKNHRLTKTKYQPKFESVELFSFIGGYMGMWLGLSLVAVFDFLETLFYIVYFPIGRWRQRPRRTKIRHSFEHGEAADSRPHI